VFDPIFKSIKYTTEKEKKIEFNTVTIVVVDGTDARQNASVNSTTRTKTATSTIHNPTRVKANTAATMLLHNNSLKYVQDFFYIHIELL
jgi:hypothetical protein